MLKAERHVVGRLRPWAAASSQVTSPTSSVDSAKDTVTFTLDAAYSSYWFTYNELSQVTPIPIAWDITERRRKPPARVAARAASYTSVTTTTSLDRCLVAPSSTSAKTCAAVFDLPHGQERSRRPRHLRHEPALEDRRRPLQPESASTPPTAVRPWCRTPSYSGHAEAVARRCSYLPRSRPTPLSSTCWPRVHTLNIGYVPPQNVPALHGHDAWCGTGHLLQGANNSQLATNYNLCRCRRVGRQLLRRQLHQPRPTAPIVKQPYVRQAMQSLQNQSLWIRSIRPGYGCPDLRSGAGVPADGLRLASARGRTRIPTTRRMPSCSEDRTVGTSCRGASTPV